MRPEKRERSACFYEHEARNLMDEAADRLREAARIRTAQGFERRSAMLTGRANCLEAMILGKEVAVQRDDLAHQHAA